jgi:hypothetical protein
LFPLVLARSQGSRRISVQILTLTATCTRKSHKIIYLSSGSLIFGFDSPQSQNQRNISNLAISINALESGKQPVATLIGPLLDPQLDPNLTILDSHQDAAGTATQYFVCVKINLFQAQDLLAPRDGLCGSTVSPRTIFKSGSKHVAALLLVKKPVNQLFQNLFALREAHF